MTTPPSSRRIPRRSILALCVAALMLTAATPGFRQLILNSANQPTSDIDIGGSHVVGTLNAARLPAGLTPAAPTITASSASGVVSIAPADLLSAATVYYTLDGTAPTSASQRYQGPFILPASATTTVKAIAYLGAPGAVATQAVTTGVEDDADVATWRTNVATAGGTLSALNVAAANQFMAGVRLAGLRSKLQYVLLNVGDYNASGVPLIKDYGSNPTRYNSSSSNYSEAGGYAPNGTSTWWDTGYIPATAGQSLNGASYFARIINNVGSGGILFSAFTTGAVTVNIYPCYGAFPRGGFGGNDASGGASVSVAGMVTLSRLSATNETIYLDGLPLGTMTTTVSGTAPTNSVQMFRGAQYSSGYSNAQITVAGMGLGLTATDVANLSNFVKQFDANFGR